jgi:TolB-like protein
VRITGHLIDATSGIRLWADRFDRNLDDIFDLQDLVTAGVVGAITPAGAGGDGTGQAEANRRP